MWPRSASVDKCHRGTTRETSSNTVSLDDAAGDAGCAGGEPHALNANAATNDLKIRDTSYIIIPYFFARARQPSWSISFALMSGASLIFAVSTNLPVVFSSFSAM